MRNRKGATLVLVAMMLVMLLAFVGIAVDLSRMYAYKAQLQTTADAAAMAAIVEVLQKRPANGPDSAIAYGARNKVEGNSITLDRAEVEPGVWDTTSEAFTPTPDGSWTSPVPQAVRVTAHYPVGMTFASLFSPTRTVTTRAIGMLGYIGTTDCIKPWAVSYQTMLDQLYPPAGSKPPSYPLTAADIADLASDSIGNEVTLLRSQNDPVAPGNVAQVVTYTQSWWQNQPPGVNGSPYGKAVSSPVCPNLPIGPGTWLDTDPGGGPGQTANPIKDFCDANGGVTPPGGGNKFTCRAHPRVKLAIWDINNGATGDNLKYRVKYIGVFAVTGFDKGNGSTQPDQIKGFFTAMATTGSISATPSPIQGGILVR